MQLQNGARGYPEQCRNRRETRSEAATFRIHDDRADRLTNRSSVRVNRIRPTHMPPTRGHSPGRPESGEKMNEDVLDHYTWATGDCFKCAGREIPTARVGRITAQSGATHPVRACRDCLWQMEAQRALRAGTPRAVDKLSRLCKQAAHAERNRGAAGENGAPGSAWGAP
ncbi:hypothetical protein TPA0909_32060 [Streptomyces albus]|nr:hypothetical protein TPA0909_32060 [Streptomyces albus]